MDEFLNQTALTSKTNANARLKMLRALFRHGIEHELSWKKQLKWTDIRPNHISLYTRKARNSDVKEIVIPMNNVLRETIKQIPVVGDYVFINPKTGQPYVYRKRFLKTLCKNAGVQPFTFHSIRHFSASLLDNKNVPLTTIQRLLGHERATTTDIYLQELRGTTFEAIRQLEEIVPTNTPHQKKDDDA
ncbi:MAG: tyrosine-type recombinase/integrase [Nitrospiraceae bacterium]|nr:tyrosine-type recombinase/integrase [Nitrospiraceae bacterium]